MAFTENYSPFLTDFGVAAVVGGVSCTGIFDKAFSDVLGIVAGTSPTFLVAAAAVPAAAVGDTVTIAAVAYTIAEIQPDGTGMTRLILKS